MKKEFNNQNLSEAEILLEENKINYKKRVDGTIVVYDDLDFSSKNLTELPDLSNVIIRGDFSCNDNLLTNLKGAPKKVIGDFDCYDNELISLKGAPKKIRGHFDCSNNLLINLIGAPETVTGDFSCLENKLRYLEGAPESIGENFDCSENQLISLEGSPKEVGKDFNCSDNQLTSLEGSPKEVGKDFDCSKNKLTCLEGVSEEFKELISDFGDFDCFEDIPEKILYSPETLAHMKAEAKKELEDKCKEAITLQKPLKIKKPPKF